MKNTFFIIIFLIIFLSVPAYSQEEAVDAEGVITSIEIIGLNRTKLHVVMYPLERFIGVESSAFDENEVFAIIKNMNVLEPISVDLVQSDDGLLLQIVVQEKWSIFPFPLVFASSGDFILGLFFYDANAFGLRDTAVIGGSFSENGWTIITMYSHTPKQTGVPGWNAVVMYNRNERENVDRNETALRKYEADRLRISFGINYLFSDSVSCLFNVNFTDITLRDNDSSFNSPEQGAMLFGFNPRFLLQQSSWDGYFLSTKSFSIDYTYNLAISGTSFHQVDYRGIYEQSLIPGFRFNVKSGGVWKSTEEPLFEEGPQKAQVNFFPRNYSALYYIGLSAGLEQYLYRNNWGTLSVQGSYQGAFSYRPTCGIEFDHGLSAGIIFYLSRIALPAVSLGVAYNMVSDFFQFSFSIGMAF